MIKYSQSFEFQLLKPVKQFTDSSKKMKGSLHSRWQLIRKMTYMDIFLTKSQNHSLNVAWMRRSSVQCLNLARHRWGSELSSYQFVWTIRMDLIQIWMTTTRLYEISAFERWLLTPIFSCQIQLVIPAKGSELFENSFLINYVTVRKRKIIIQHG